MQRISKQTCLLVVTQKRGATRDLLHTLTRSKEVQPNVPVVNFPNPSCLFIIMSWRTCPWLMPVKEKAMLSQLQNSTSAWLPCFCCLKCCPHRGYFFLSLCVHVCFGSIGDHMSCAVRCYTHKQNQWGGKWDWDQEKHILGVYCGGKVLEYVGSITI